ncbi:hypothetical protein ACVWW5_007063 [Bradyrhizobium sp. LM3.4]
MLLANAGLQFEAIAADIDERGTQAASKIFQTARDWPLLARQKAKAVSAHPSGGYVIRADQTLVTVWAPNPEAKSRLRASAALHRRNRSCDHEAYGDRQRWESMFVSLTRVCRSSKAKSVSPHVLRHSGAMELLQAGAHCSVIALWLGHESGETTQTYLQPISPSRKLPWRSLSRTSAASEPASSRTIACSPLGAL